VSGFNAKAQRFVVSLRLCVKHFPFRHPLPFWLIWPGGVLMAISEILFWRAHADLGRNWSPSLEIGDDHTLVTRGIYHRVRHPMYASFFLYGIAQIMLLPNWIAGPSTIIAFLPLYIIRPPREEQMMIDRFGDEYIEYMNSTGRMLPRLNR
jgi:protein-S-isoprenylcysteine O-methyltransferase Ste14